MSSDTGVRNYQKQAAFLAHPVQNYILNETQKHSQHDQQSFHIANPAI